MSASVFDISSEKISDAASIVNGTSGPRANEFKQWDKSTLALAILGVSYYLPCAMPVDKKVLEIIQRQVHNLC